MKLKKTISKKRLEQYTNELIALAKTKTPDVETTLHVPGYEGQLAWMEMYVPDELVDEIEDLVAGRATDILISDGYDIGVIVYEKSEMEQPASEVHS